MTRARTWPASLLKESSMALALALAACATATMAAAASEKTERPNIVFILADDMGYSDLGCYGGEIETPHLDALAAGGLRFTQFYNTARCWPTRAALLTGYYAQEVRRDAIPGAGGGARGGRQNWARLLPDFLKPHGYRSYHSGKWHIDGKVLAGGFDRSLDMRNQGNFFSAAGNQIDDQPVRPAGDESGYYATIATADHAIECLREHAEKYSDRPFFHYVAFIAPHFPLHAMPEDISRYQDKYVEGWDVMRRQRFARQKEMGLLETTLSELEPTVGPPYHFPDALVKLGPGEVNRPLPWNELDEVQQRFQATKMAIHAAMVYRMDQEIGRIVDQLKAMGAYENTLICFASDNGASAEIMVRHGGHDPLAEPGSAATYLCLGPGFSSACNTPFRRHKTWVHEGGTGTPFVVHWPARIKTRGELRHTPGHVIDFVIRWRTVQTPERSTQLLALGLLLTINSLLNAYTPIYDLTLLILPVLLIAESLITGGRQAGNVRAPRGLTWVYLSLSVIYFGPHLSQTIAKLTGCQLFALALAAMAIWQARQFWIATRTAAVQSSSRENDKALVGG